MNSRKDGRKNDELRQVSFERGYLKNAIGSCFVKLGGTHVVCAASFEDRVPPFLRNTGSGWVTAEYGMLPCSTNERMEREAAKGKQTGRTQEIQRLISRSLRTVVNLRGLGERQIKIDCDVIQADGGTRTASITGGYVALCQAVDFLLKKKIILKNPIVGQIAAISCGVVNGQALLDLNYSEDSIAETDANFVMNSHGNIAEIQMTAERDPFSKVVMTELLALAEKGIKELIAKQMPLCNLNE
jgi:ribonuclease PH